MKPTIIRTLSNHSELGTLVELARDEEQDLTYVIKRIRYLETPLSHTIFIKESMALARLKACENIVRIYKSEVCATEDGHTEGVISMEYVPGVTLKNKMDSIPSSIVRYSLVRQLIKAVRHAHENSVIHRDINPNNILITEDYELKLIDFGISKIRGLTVNAGTTCQFATLGYSAPEVILHSENATRRSDIYSVGAVIYYLFTGNTPETPEKMPVLIAGSGGMDEDLKKILTKMCALSPDNRYETIDDCEEDFLPLYQRYCNSNEHYYFAVPYEHIEKLKQRHLIPDYKNSITILNENLPQQFSCGYARIRYVNEKRIYCFDGVNISMECDYINGIFHVCDFKRLEVFKRESYKRYAFPIPGRYHFFFTTYLASTPTANSSNIILYNRFDEFEHNLKSQRHIDDEYESNYGIWRQFIQVMIQDASQNAIRIKYTSFDLQDGILLFHIDETAMMDLPDEDFNQETVFIFEKGGKNKGNPLLIKIGTFLEYRDDGSTLAIKNTGRSLDIPHSGLICVDYRMDIQQYRNQEQALEEFKRSETSNSGNLKGIFVGIDEPGRFHLTEELSYYNQELDVTQKRAVKKILEANDIALIQGPPGTGKTNVLVEVVRQVLKQNRSNPASKSRMLIVSQSHAAVDKILEDLRPHLNGATTIRIGSEDNINPEINVLYGLNHCEQHWQEESIKNCKQSLIKMLSDKGIQYENFETFSTAVENLKMTNNLKEDNTKWNDIVTKFENAYHIATDSPFLQRCLAMDQWRRHLAEHNELGEYYIKDATVVAGTCSGFIANHFVRDIVFDYVIVDEAAKATLPELMVALVRAKKVILVGDHKQLPPVFDRKAISRADTQLRISDLEDAGFGRLWNFLPDTCRETLSTQYRMHPCIGTMISQVFYEWTIQNGVSAEKRSIELPFLEGHPITWISTANATGSRTEEPQPGTNGKKSYTNPLEVTVLQRFLSRLDKEMAKSGRSYSIGIITPYRAQLDLIRQRLRHATFSYIKFDINTVDAFQGSQRDIIIYSTVRSSDTKKIGFLNKEARLNVSLSRAKRALVIIGDAKFFDNPKIHKNIFLPILQYIQSNPKECVVIDERMV